jgi:DNA-binding response OmpR family regulator
MEGGYGIARCGLSCAKLCSLNMTKILCVDDDVEGMASRKDVLESAGHQVWQALSADEALRIIQTEEIELAIVDYYLANTNGLALATDMKQLKSTLAIIMLSGFGQLPGEGVGIANAWILKGSGPKQLLLAVRKIMAEKNRELGTTAET